MWPVGWLRRWWQALIPLALAACTLFLFLRACLADFSVHDDSLYVVDNRHLREGLSTAGIRWAFTTLHAANWHPLTWLSLELDYELFQLNPAGYHLTNILLHAFNTMLVFWVLRSYTGAVWRSACVALLFGIHPLHVESVAWISERKDVLSTFFWLLTMWFYRGYAAWPSIWRYSLVALFLTCGLMAKPMLVTLPCVLLLMDYWPLARWRWDGAEQRALTAQAAQIQSRSWQRLLWEKLPLVALCAVASALTILAQSRGGAVNTLLPWKYRWMNATDAYIAYLAKTAWPLNLACYYPHTGSQQVLVIALANAAILAAVTVWAWRKRSTTPYLLVGWLWYLGTLVPVIGLVQVGAQSLADRYTYVPLIGIFWMFVWGINDLVSARLLSLKLAVVLALAAASSFAACTWMQVGYWLDDELLWQRALEVGGPFSHTYEVLSSVLMKREKYKEAVPHLRAFLLFEPRNAEGHLNLGIALMQLGEPEEGRRELERAIELNPENAAIQYNLGNLHQNEGRLEEAAGHLRKAIAIDPYYWRAHLLLSSVLARQGDHKEAQACYEEALRLNPELAMSLGAKSLGGQSQQPDNLKP